MPGSTSLPDLLLIIIAVLLALIGAISAETIVRGYAIALLFLIIVFWILFAFSRKRGWTLSRPLPLVRTVRISEIFLSLALFTSTVAVAWYIGMAVSRAFSDVDGILAGLVIFGIISLVFPAYREQKDS